MRLLRLFIVGVALLVSTTAAAQTRWTLSAGPEWTPYFSTSDFIGGRVRGEYDLITPTKPLRLRLELGGYWEPSQTYVVDRIDGSTVAGWKQSMDLTFGISASFTPVPGARVAPYLTIGALARQAWKNVSTFYFPAGNGTPTVGRASGTAGDMVFPLGVGLRARIAGHMFQVEMRQFRQQHSTALTVGSNLPF